MVAPDVAVCASVSGLVLLALTLPVRASAADEQTFASPQDAVNALVAAATNHDTNALHSIFGPAGHGLISPDVVQATEEFKMFVQHLTEKTQLVTNSDSNVTLEIGADGWPFPIPLVKQDGQWFFDTAAGQAGDSRPPHRPGRNWARLMSATRMWRRSANMPARIAWGTECSPTRSSCAARPARTTAFSGRRISGEELSPLGPLVAQARVEGYHRTAKMLNDEQAPYHGYYFKILTRQGKHAPGGKYNYVINGRMIAGFALVAWPAEWGNTGVMTFIVNQQGKVYQKNLGPKTAKIARGMTTYDPDDTWTPAQ